MARIYLIRHGEPSAGWGEHDDPGLSALGAKQAADAAYKLGALKPARLVTSPLARCRETAAAFEMESGHSALVDPRVAEIPSPNGVDDRQAWLRGLMMGAWSSAPELAAWRNDVIAALTQLTEDTAVFSHFVAINVAVGASLGEDAVTIFRPGHCSITTLQTDGNRLTLSAKGAETAAVTLL